MSDRLPQNIIDLQTPLNKKTASVNIWILSTVL